MKKVVLVLIIILMFSVIYVNPVFMVAVKADDKGYVPQPSHFNSTLSVYSADCKAPGLKDWELKKLIEKYIVPKGYHSMKFVFGQCYGGGFIDEVLQFGNDTHPVVAISGCMSNETAKAGSPPGWDWTEFVHRFKEAIDKDPKPTLKKAFEEANKADVYGPNHPENHNKGPDWAEHPQYKSQGAGADNLKLGNASTSKTWKALLFVGKPTDPRHMNNLDEIHDTLTKKYGYEDDRDIEVLCGDGTGRPWIDGNATLASLEKALQKIGDKMNSTEQFFFWSNDHGDSEFCIEKFIQKIIETIHEEIFSLPKWMIHDMKVTPTNAPFISMCTYNVTTPNNRVYFNGFLLGNLTYTGIGGTHYEILYFDDNVVPLYEIGNVLTIERNQPEPFTVSDKEISGGSIPENPPPYELWIITHEGGTTDPAPGSYLCLPGTLFTVTAKPYSGWVFDRWELDGIIVSRAISYTVKMDNNHILEAFFKRVPVGGITSSIDLPMTKVTLSAGWITPVLIVSVVFITASIATLYKRKHKNRKASQ